MTTVTTSAAGDTEIYKVSGLKVIGIWLLALIVRGWCRTIRFELSASDAKQADTPEPVVAMLWHNRLFAVPWAAQATRPGRAICGLVSASRDGAALAKFLEFLGIRSVRGSSSRLGREALHKLIAEHREGHDIAITPDGPRGPIYQVKPGAVLAARRTGSPMLLIGVHYERAWRLRSWDRFYIPVPFSRARVRVAVIGQEELRSREDAAGWLGKRLLELSGESDEKAQTKA